MVDLIRTRWRLFYAYPIRSVARCGDFIKSVKLFFALVVDHDVIIVSSERIASARPLYVALCAYFLRSRTLDLECGHPSVGHRVARGSHIYQRVLC